LSMRPLLASTSFPYTTLFRSSFFFSGTKTPLRERRGSDRLIRSALVRSSPKDDETWSRSLVVNAGQIGILLFAGMVPPPANNKIDRKSTRLNSSHGSTSYAVL